MPELPPHYLAFVAASAALIAVPGPNVAVIVATSIRQGVRAGLCTVAGTSAAMVVQLAMTVAGLSGALAFAAHAFEALRWAGVLYLLWLAAKAFGAPTVDLAALPAREGKRLELAGRGFLVSLTNPKTLLFYAAFLPQFASGRPETLTEELGLLAATFLALAVLLDSLWALGAARLSGALRLSGRILNWLTGGVLAGAAAGLAIVHRPQ